MLEQISNENYLRKITAVELSNQKQMSKKITLYNIVSTFNKIFEVINSDKSNK